MAACTSDAKYFNCKLCLENFEESHSFQIAECGCKFCKQCMTEYVKVGISEGNISLKCPDNQCLNDQPLSKHQIEDLAADQIERYHQLSFEREIEMDSTRVFCPKSGCTNVCNVPQMPLPCNTWDQNSLEANLQSDAPKFWKGIFSKSSPNHISRSQVFTCFLPITCTSCSHKFCVYCKQEWHTIYHHSRCADKYFQSMHLLPGSSPESKSGSSKTKAKRLKQDISTLPELEGSIKRCPRCFILIERDDGCAQMRCCRCKHVFCWFCLEPLNDDILLRHYDGPCKVNFGHSRASLVRHRVQVVCSLIGICILIILNSPLILFVCVCLLACKYIRSCFSRSKNGHASSADPQSVTGQCVYTKQDNLATFQIPPDDQIQADSFQSHNENSNVMLDLSANIQSIFTYSDVSIMPEEAPPVSDNIGQSSSTSKAVEKAKSSARKKSGLFIFRGSKPSRALPPATV